ncbi:MAG: 50S ribosomal protein L18e [archaeon]|nr:50S ribosomal protein L18e [archaeon]
MRKTGPTKLSTRKLIRELEQKAKSSKQKIWAEIARILSKPSRNRAKINLFKLDKLSQRFDGKTFLIVGKVLATGDLTKKINIVALNYSGNAKQKIHAMKGNAMTLNEIVHKEIKPSEVMIVK